MFSQRELGYLLSNPEVRQRLERAAPLIAQHITAAEWGEMVAASAVGIEPEQLPLLFGLMMCEGDPEVIGETIEHMPPEVRPVMTELAEQADLKYPQDHVGVVGAGRFGDRAARQGATGARAPGVRGRPCSRP